MSHEILALLVVTALFAGFVDAIAGGGGMITVPALILAGLTPAQAIATNKFQATFGVGFAAYHFYKAGKVETHNLKLYCFCAAIGAILGGFTVQYVPQEGLKTILPFILLLVAFYFFLAPRFKFNASLLLTPLTFALFCLFPLGFYDGFFGPGTGAFCLLLCQVFLGQSLTQSAGLTKVLNLTSNFASLLVFLLSGTILWGVAFAMLFGQLIGAYLGTKAALKFEAKLIRPLVIGVCLALSCKLLFFS
jgi:uncharacterized protein